MANETESKEQEAKSEIQNGEQEAKSLPPVQPKKTAPKKNAKKKASRKAPAKNDSAKRNAGTNSNPPRPDKKYQESGDLLIPVEEK